VARPRSSSLTEAELRIMDVMWEKGRASVADVAEALPKDPPLAYNTVLTTMRILEEKGYLSHSKRKDARAFVYRPLVAREEATRKAVRHLVSRFFRGSSELLVLNVLNDDDLSQAELTRIRKLIAGEGR
jgi:predicted transcriptional regulator